MQDKKQGLCEKEIKAIADMYNISKLAKYEFKNSSREDNDIRYTYIVHFENTAEPIVIKVAKNSFTTDERIAKWKDLCKIYLEAGIYCPQVIKCKKNNEYSFGFIDNNGIEYTVYAEEFKKYKTVDEYVDEQLSAAENKEAKRSELDNYFHSFAFEEKVYETIGIMASKHIEAVPWYTAYCLYDKFCSTDLYDDNYESADLFYRTLKKKLGTENDLLESIWKNYNKMKAEFEEEYRKLPQSVFQGDLNSTNLLIDDDLKFVGLIDFNLSGTDTILNYALCECLYYMESEEEFNEIGKPSFWKKSDDYVKRKLSAVKKHYHFTKQELDAFNKYYNIVVPFRFPYTSDFIKLINDGKMQYIDGILKWMNYQLTRSDVLSILE